MALRYGSEGDEVEVLQRILTGRGFSTAGVDGDFGYQTLSAVFRFQRQIMAMKTPDGIVGPQTLAALGLSPAIIEGSRPQPSSPPDTDEIPPNAPKEAAPAANLPHFSLRAEDSDGGKFTHHYAEFTEPTTMSVYAGYGIAYEAYFGLAQSTRRFNDIGAIRYEPGPHEATHGLWAHLVVPTGTGESGLWFERLNTYDRAAFTFGFFQAAAHYPNENFILLFKDMLARPEARQWFPELALRDTPTGSRLFWLKDAEEIDLEVAEPRSPTNREPNLKRFMAYLNADKVKVDDQELDVAARILGWTRHEHGCRALQVAHAVRGLQSRMANFRKTLTGRPVDQCLMTADVIYQWRAGTSDVLTALNSASPYDALCKLGDSEYQGRVKTVDAQIGLLMKQSEISRLKFDPAAPNLFR